MAKAHLSPAEKTELYVQLAQAGYGGNRRAGERAVVLQRAVEKTTKKGGEKTLNLN